VRIAALALWLLLAFPVLAIDDCSAELAALHALYDLRSLVVDTDASSYEISSRINEHLETLRDPLPEGGYRWVRFVRPKSGSGPVVKREHLIEAVHGSEELESFEAAADHVYSVRVAVPRKRSLLSANKEAYVDTLKIRYLVDGEEESMEKAINQWIKPDTSKTFDLGVIADRVDTVAEVATRAASVRQSLVEVQFIQAVAQDDPESPYADAVSLLKKIQYDATPRAIDDEIARLEYQAFGRSSTVPLAQIAVALRDAERLIASDDEEEREKGRKLFKDTLRLLH